MTKKVIEVKFRDGKTETFSTVAAIFRHYTREQIGCSKGTMYTYTLKKPVETKRCVITKKEVKQ